MKTNDQYLGKSDMYRDLEHNRSENEQLDKISSEFVKQLKETDTDEDYKNLMMCVLTKEERFVPSTKKRKRSDDSDSQYDEDGDSEEKDPQYKLFLRNLKKHEHSYVFKYKKKGSFVSIKYEGESDDFFENPSEHGLHSGLAEEGKEQKSRKLRHSNSRGKTEAVKSYSKQMPPCLDDISICKNTKIEDSEGLDKVVESVIKSKDLMLPDSDYLLFIENIQGVGDSYVLSYGGCALVYEKRSIAIIPENQENDDDDSDLKILDSAATSKDGNSSFKIEESSSKMLSDFRKKLLCILRKPYDREEYKKLLQEAEFRKPMVRNMDLRFGREIAYPTNKAGKSYLDNYPDFKKVLSRFHNDRPRCLNLLRGFFFWLQSFQQDGSFKPWQDSDCLAVRPGS